MVAAVGLSVPGENVVRKRALIVKFGQIGDVIMAIPAVRLLYEKGFEIHWVCGSAAQPLLECYSWIHLIPVDDRTMLRGNRLQQVRETLRLWSKVAIERYDLCATLYFDRRYRILTLPIRAGRKVALSRESRETDLLAGRHHTDEFARVLLQWEDGCRDHSTPPFPPDRLPSSRLPEKVAPRRIAIVPGGTSNVLGQQTLRRWPIENYLTLAHSLLDRGWEVVLFGGKEDAWVKPYFHQMSVTDCIDKLSLPEMISACDACDAVVTHDTGPLHMAGLSRTCLVGIFGPTDPATRVPRRPLAVGIWGGQGFACRPCYDGRNFAPCQFNGCMHQVTPERVLRELDQLFSAQSMGVSNPWRVVYPDANPSAVLR